MAKKLSQIIYYCNKKQRIYSVTYFKLPFSSTLHSCLMQIRAICAYKIYKYLMHMENVSQAWPVKTAKRATTVHWKPMIGHAKRQVLWDTINSTVLLDPWWLSTKINSKTQVLSNLYPDYHLSTCHITEYLLCSWHSGTGSTSFSFSAP